MTGTCTVLLPANHFVRSFPVHVHVCQSLLPSASTRAFHHSIRKYVDTDMTSSLSSSPSTPTHQGQSHNDLTAPKKTKRRPGRPLLSFAELRARKEAREAARRSKNKRKFPQAAFAATASLLEATQSKRRNGSSALEQLPVELLERIFLYALETNFCRASPFLASAVSSERIYRTLIRLAFFKDGDFPSLSGKLRQQIKTARDGIADALKPADYITMRLDETDRVNLQATILRCRWCTKKRILAQLPALTQMLIWKHWVGAGMVLPDPTQQASLETILQVCGPDGLENAPIGTFDGTGPDGQTYYMYIRTLIWTGVRCADADVDVHRVMSIRVLPDYLLRGRRVKDNNKWHFIDDDLDLLELFLIEYGPDGSGHDVQFSRDAVQAGIRTAMTTRNMRALATLLKTDEFFFRRRLTTDPPPGYVNQLAGQYYAILEEHFLQAIQLPMPDAIYCFLLLLRCNAECLPPDSSELTQWAMGLSVYHPNADSKVSDDEINLARRFGKWLLDFMIELPGYIDESREVPQEKALFFYGGLNIDLRLGDRFMDEVCDYIDPGFWEGVGERWVCQFSYDVEKSWSTDVH